MSALISPRYQFDRTGSSPDNYIVDELHNLPVDGARVIVMSQGVFYTHDFAFRPKDSATYLNLGTDYRYVSVDAEITAMTGMETATAIEVLNDAIFGELLLTYRAVGGVEGRSNSLVQDLITAIDLAKDSKVDYRTLSGVPSQFPPAPHSHEVSDLTGLEAVTQALNKLTTAVTDARPLKHSALELHAQDDRNVKLIGELQEDVSAIAGTGASAEQVMELAERVSSLGFGEVTEGFRILAEAMYETRPLHTSALELQNKYDQLLALINILDVRTNAIAVEVATKTGDLTQAVEQVLVEKNIVAGDTVDISDSTMQIALDSMASTFEKYK